MNFGDRVIVPTWGAFHVYEIATDERLVPADIDGDLNGLEKLERDNGSDPGWLPFGDSRRGVQGY